MAEELKSLLERIQKDGVEKAQADAQAIIAKAKEEAAAIRQSAEKEAAAKLRKADEDSKAFDSRSRKSIEQAARDIVISVGQAINTTFAGIISRKVDNALTDDTLKQMLQDLVKAYFGAEGGSQIELMLKPEQKEALSQYFTEQFAAEIGKGLEIKGDARVLSGFRVSQVADRVEHDFSGEAITDALCTLLRPHVAEIVRSAMAKTDA